MTNKQENDAVQELPHWRFIDFQPSRALRGAAAAKVEVDSEGEWVWMTARDIGRNIRHHGDHPELQKALAAYKGLA